jgi:hypothetical protein
MNASQSQETRQSNTVRLPPPIAHRRGPAAGWRDDAGSWFVGNVECGRRAGGRGCIMVASAGRRSHADGRDAVWKRQAGADGSGRMRQAETPIGRRVGESVNRAKHLRQRGDFRDVRSGMALVDLGLLSVTRRCGALRLSRRNMATIL